MTSNTELCHIIMKWNVSILLGTYRQYSSQIVNQSGKGYGHSLSRSFLQNIYFCNEDSTDNSVAVQLEKKIRTRTTLSKCILFRTKLSHFEYLKQKSSTTPTPNPQKYFDSFSQSELRLDFNQGSETSVGDDLWRIII